MSEAYSSRCFRDSPQLDIARQRTLETEMVTGETSLSVVTRRPVMVVFIDFYS